MNEPKKYRKRPVVIEAMRWDGTHAGVAALEAWSEGAVHLAETGVVVVDTLEGFMVPVADDFIIKGVAGEFYPCKPDIFEQSYEAV